MDTLDLKKKAVQLRKKTWQLIYQHNNGHTGSCLSCTDILVALYYGVMNQTPDNLNKPDTDTYIQSKGHAVEIWYEILADKGYISQKDLDNGYSTFNTPFIGHPTTEVKGMEFHTGSLGHGLGLGVGVALAAKINKNKKRTFVLMGDGEQAEGSIWEAAMAAGNYNLDNLIAIVDHNELQISGTTNTVTSTGLLDGMFKKSTAMMLEHWLMFFLKKIPRISQELSSLTPLKAKVFLLQKTAPIGTIRSHLKKNIKKD